MSERFTITISFTTSPAPTVTASPESVSIDYGQQGVIQLTLSTQVRGAVFAANPVLWDGQPPPGVSVNRVNDYQAQIIATDRDSATTGYSFRAQVGYNGQTYQSPDPVIIEKGGP